MAELDFEIKGSHGDIAASTFGNAVARAVALLREFDSAISGKPTGLFRWYVERLHSNGSLVISFHSKMQGRNLIGIADTSPVIARSLLDGLDLLENKCETPSYLSMYGLQKVDSLASMIGRNGATGFRFTSSSQAVDVTIKTHDNVAKLLPIKRKSIGSVEGKLEAVNLHGQSRMIVYHGISKKAVICEFDETLLIGRVKEYLGHNVVAFGELYKNINGDTLRLAMDRLELAEDLRKSRQNESAQKGLPEFAAARSTADYIKGIRGG